MNEYPDSDIYAISFKKLILTSSMSNVEGDLKAASKSVLHVITEKIRDKTGKAFVPISFMNDPDDSKLRMKLVLANH